MSFETTPVGKLHRHTFPNGNIHRHAHLLGPEHPEPINEAHPKPYYFLCRDCEPQRFKIARDRADRRIAEEFTP